MSSVIDGLMEIVANLDTGEQKTLVDRLISSGILCESAEDALVIASRKDEPTTSYRHFRRRRLAGGKAK